MHYCMSCESLWNISGYRENADQQRADAEYVIHYREIIETHSQTLLDELRQKFKFSRILEIGCGVGYFLNAASKAGLKAVGYEINPFAVQAGRDLFPHIDIRNEFWSPMENKDRYDLVVTVGVLEHQEEPRKLFSAMVSGLNDEGHIYANVPFVEREQWSFLHTVDPTTPGTFLMDNDVHIIHFSQKGLIEMGRQHGAQEGRFFICEDRHTHSPGGSYQGVLFDF